MERIELKNRKGQNIVGLLEKPAGEIKGTGILQHGWGGNKEKTTMQAIKRGFHNAGFQTFNFDTTNTFGESDGDYEQSSQRLHTEDFFDVMTWAKQQNWYIRPVAISGHSMGGYSVAKYTEEHQEDVDFCIPVAPLVSGELLYQQYEKNRPEEIKKWKEEGVLESVSKEGDVKRKHYWQYEEWGEHDLLPEAHKITCSSLLIVGSEDDGCAPVHMQALLDAIGAKDKMLHVIEGAPHSYYEQSEQDECERVITEWLQTRVN